MIKAKKSLGQNFLIDDKILNEIVNCVKIENKNILEIGPGTGNLTKYILNKKPKKFTEVGYVGRDVEQIVRDLVEIAISMEKVKKRKEVFAKAQKAAEEKVLTI